MRVIKLFNNWYESLCEMAYDRKKIMHDLEANEQYRVDHLIKLFLFREDSNNTSHWISEVYRACYKTSKWSKNNKYLSLSDIEQVLWYGWEDCYYDRIDKIIKNVCIKEDKDIPVYNKETLYSFLEDYHLWLAQELSNTGYVDIDECKQFIKILLDKYERY